MNNEQPLFARLPKYKQKELSEEYNSMLDFLETSRVEQIKRDAESAEMKKRLDKYFAEYEKEFLI